MDDALIAGLKNGFIFELVGDGNIPDRSYSITATPESSVSGRCVITSNQSGAIQFMAPNTPAGPGAAQGGGSLTCDEPKSPPSVSP